MMLSKEVRNQKISRETFVGLFPIVDKVGYFHQFLQRLTYVVIFNDYLLFNKVIWKIEKQLVLLAFTYP